MKQLTVLLLLILPIIGFSQENQNYDPAKAKELGADEYGMRNYIFVMLTSPENPPIDPEAQALSFEGHMENISVLAERGDLIVAGPFGENDLGFRGLFILATDQMEVAKEWMKNDPAIENGFLKATYIPWYGSAALPMYLEDADKVWKKKP